MHDGQFSQHDAIPMSSLQPMRTAMERIDLNGSMAEEKISFLDYEALKAPKLKKDYQFPVLHEFLPFQTLYLSIWPKFEHKPIMIEGEAWHCVINGTEKIRMISPVFN